MRDKVLMALCAALLACGTVTTVMAGDDEVPTITKAYYVGDLLTRPDREGEKIDMTPIVDLITSTVNPGTWDRNQPRGGSITPFHLSISLVVRHDRETHERIETLLRGMRKLPAFQSADATQADQNASRGVIVNSLPASRRPVTMPRPAP